MFKTNVWQMLSGGLLILIQKQIENMQSPWNLKIILHSVSHIYSRAFAYLVALIIIWRQSRYCGNSFTCQALTSPTRLHEQSLICCYLLSHAAISCLLLGRRRLRRCRRMRTWSRSQERIGVAGYHPVRGPRPWPVSGRHRNNRDRDDGYT